MLHIILMYILSQLLPDNLAKHVVADSDDIGYAV